MKNIEFIKKLKEFNDIAWDVHPEQWNCVCASYGLSLAESQNLYLKLQILIGKPRSISFLLEETSDKTIDLIFDIANKAKDLYENCNTQCFSLCGFPESHKAVAIYWEKETNPGLEQNRKELSLREPISYVYISELVKDPTVKIKTIVNQVDEIHDLRDYVGEVNGADPRSTSLRIFDGDVFCSFNKELTGSFWNHTHENGIYIATENGYRKLLYTVGKGYLRKGKPNTDDEFELDFGQGRFNKYILTMSHKWRRIGNVNVDASFLLENPKQN